jgi:hypothetical protein
VGVPRDVIRAIKYREPSGGIEAPFGTVIELIREAFTAGSVSAATYDTAVSLLGVPRLIASCPWPGCTRAPPLY